MSRPYFKINSLSYAGPTLSVNYSFFKLRGGGTVSVTGFSNSVSWNETSSNSDVSNLTYDVQPVTVATLGTSSTTTLTEGSATITFGGTVSTTTNLKIQILGVQVVNATASTYAPTLSNFLSGITFSFTGAAANFTASQTATTITFTSLNSGNIYNNTTASISTVVIGGSSFTWSNGNTFSGGLHNYTVILSYDKLGPINGKNTTFRWSNAANT